MATKKDEEFVPEIQPPTETESAPTDTNKTTVSIHIDLKAPLIAQAAKEGRSQWQVASRAIADYLEAHKDDEPYKGY